MSEYPIARGMLSPGSPVKYWYTKNGASQSAMFSSTKKGMNTAWAKPQA